MKWKSKSLKKQRIFKNNNRTSLDHFDNHPFTNFRGIRGHGFSLVFLLRSLILVMNLLTKIRPPLIIMITSRKGIDWTIFLNLSLELPSGYTWNTMLIGALHNAKQGRKENITRQNEEKEIKNVFSSSINERKKKKIRSKCVNRMNSDNRATLRWLLQTNSAPKKSTESRKM